MKFYSIKVVIFIFLASLSTLAYTHKLPQQLLSQAANFNIVHADIALDDEQITQWGIYSKTLDLSAIAQQQGIPTIVSYVANLQSKSSATAECSIYVGDEVSPLCGEIDDDDNFMKSAMAAIGYCHFKENQAGAGVSNQKLFPFFTGPSSFLTSTSETTLGLHHSVYNTSDGISFHCVHINNTASPSSENS